MRSYCYTLSFLLFLIACHKNDRFHSCPDITVKGQTRLNISEVLADTTFITPDTALANAPVRFSFSKADHIMDSIIWDIDDGGYTTSKSLFQLRFAPGSYKIRLIVNYTAFNSCSASKKLVDTIIKTLVVLDGDRSSALEGRYEGFLDTKPAERFTVTIQYWKHPNEDRGAYYIRNYVNGCTGDNVYPVPAGTGYPLDYGYKCFSIPLFYPCNRPGLFKGYGTLNNTSDSITITHFGYNNAVYIPGDTIPRWHTFKGKRI
jgi:hypothetical protein